MPLPDWAERPEPGFEHNDNYSAVDVVWKHPDGRVILQQIPTPDSIPQIESSIKTVPGKLHRSRRVVPAAMGVLGGAGAAVILHFIAHF